MSISREPVQIIEIDLDYCTHVWGAAPCTASLSSIFPRKCWNMYEHCGDRTNYNPEPLTLRFSDNIHGLPEDVLIYPALLSVVTSASEVNLSGRSDRNGLLGKRARITVTLTDFTDNDTGVDKYQAERVSGAAQLSGQGYDPEAQGLFFARLAARNPYYTGRAMRLREGYAGQAIEDMQVRHFVIEEWSGPDASGRVSVVASDPLSLVDDEKAQCPAQSVGELGAAIAAAGLPSFALQPVGVGSDYAAEGRASIGSEVVSYTRAGDTITLTGRGLDGTAAAAHNAGDLFQQAKRFENVPILDVAQELMEDFAGIPPARVNAAGWAGEVAWLDGISLTRTIPKPEGVGKLVGQLAELGVAFYWKERTEIVGCRATRPVDFGETIELFTDDGEIVSSTLRKSSLDKQRITQVLFWHGQIDPTGSDSSGSNYRRAHAGINSGGIPQRHGQDRLLEIFSPWLGEGDDSVAGAVADRLSSRFEEVPLELEFEVDAKDRGRVSLGSLVRVRTRSVQDADGAVLDRVMQVVKLHEVASGHRMAIKLHSTTLTGRFGFLMADDAPGYDDATDQDLQWGCYLVDDAIGDFGDGAGPYVIF